MESARVDVGDGRDESRVVSHIDGNHLIFLRYWAGFVFLCLSGGGLFVVGWMYAAENE